ncbi:MAG: hypothetical protein IBJ18_09915 [Phycisphaerales bacterium]|nr:hypothetical protein [Phycisphaerales bacterium]
MIHASRIDRLVRAGRFEQLLDEVLTNGRRLPIAARAMLLDDGARESCESSEAGSCVSAAVSLGVLEQASMGLALQRLVELTYVPHPLALGLARRLVAGLSHRGRDGGGLKGGALAARVMAVAGLVDLVDQCVQTREVSGMEPLGVEIDALIDELGCELSHAAAQSVATRGARGEGLVCASTLSTCLIVWQLRPRATLCASLQRFVNVAAILRAPERLGLWRDGDCAAVLALAGGVMKESAAVNPAAGVVGGGWRAA